MATALGNAADFATDGAVRAPLTAGIVSAAVQISAEAPETTNHDARIKLAHQVIGNPVGAVETFLWVLSSNSTVVNKWVTGDHDGAINDFAFVIASVWDAVALRT